MFSILMSVGVALQVQGATPVDQASRNANESAEPAKVAAPAPADSGTRRAPRRIPLTDALLASAYADPLARSLLARARAARLRQDSLLTSYEAMSYQRLSVGVAVKAIAGDRLAMRTEEAVRVRWQKDRGVWVEVTGRRAVVPIASGMTVHDGGGTRGSSAIPYIPGREQLFFGRTGMTQAQVDDRELVHPIAEGAEAYYVYSTGDSVTMTLPDGQRLMLRELRVEARQPKWNLTVGSFWFDVASAHLVRAVYRLSAPIDVWAQDVQEARRSDRETPSWLKFMVSPLRVEVSAITLEYGLYGQRFWMPRSQGVEGWAQVSFVRVPVTLEQRFAYASVNGLDSLPAVVAAERPWYAALRDSLRIAGASNRVADSVTRARSHEVRERERASRARECAASGVYTRRRTMYDGALSIATSVPCDSVKLANSPDLPPSIFDGGEELFAARDRAELGRSLTFGLQALWGPQMPKVEWGLPLTRYNRAEGFSSALALSSVLGRGFTARAEVRASLADRQLNGELTLSRSNGRSTLGASAYRRLVAGNDWGSPLSFGASLSSLLYARDEGQYYRTWGAEFVAARGLGGALDWRIFAERQGEAAVASRWTPLGGPDDPRFIPNPAAEAATEFGTSGRLRSRWGLDPNRLRLETDVRAEAATGGFTYARGLFDATASRRLGFLAASITVGAGASLGVLPVQRRFYLGGLHTVRGETALAASGEAFWRARAEVGTSATAVRPVVFADLGWAGRRSDIAWPGQPLSGAGAGISVLDGLIRFDVAQGLSPVRQIRADLQLEAKF